MLFIALLIFTVDMPYIYADIYQSNQIQDGYIVLLKEDSTCNLENSELEELVDSQIYIAKTKHEIYESVPIKNICCIEPNYILRPSVSYTPNDTYYGDSRWTQDIMNVQKVWNRGYFGNYTNSSNAPIVGIIDSGIIGTGNFGAQLLHEDLNYSNVSPGKNTINDNINTKDDFGHGTFIAGIISGTHNNGLGIAGNMPELKLRAYKCVDAYGYCSLANEVSAIYAAINDSVDVINISLDMGSESQIEKNAINEATEKGIIVCASAGNDGREKKNYPASHENVISVGSINKKMEKSNFSQYNKMLDCTAPGENIISLDYRSTKGYITSSGTSFSCPQVTALAAMCKSIDSTIDHDRFMELLKSTSRDAGTPGYDTSYGWGIVDYGNMLDALVPEDNSIWAAEITGISSDADYTGNEIRFENLKITMPDGTELSADSDYTVAYYNNKNSEMGMLTIRGIGEYTGRINKYFTIHGVPNSGGYSGGGTILPPAPSSAPESSSDKSESTSVDSKPAVKISKPTIKKIKAGKKFFIIIWKKTKNVDGYQLQYSTSKTFRKSTRVSKTISKTKTSYKAKSLKAGKRYYVRMRGYKMVDGKKKSGGWSATKVIMAK